MENAIAQDSYGIAHFLLFTKHTPYTIYNSITGKNDKLEIIEELLCDTGGRTLFSRKGDCENVRCKMCVR